MEKFPVSFFLLLLFDNFLSLDLPLLKSPKQVLCDLVLAGKLLFCFSKLVVNFSRASSHSSSLSPNLLQCCPLLSKT
uniref:Putative secreted protein n=1 Tax=Panstrongylus lignarius TaxID=156445 RepID=A0A224Y5L9_9HEMI